MKKGWNLLLCQLLGTFAAGLHSLGNGLTEAFFLEHSHSTLGGAVGAAYHTDKLLGGLARF